jgi:chemotaxis signal transduction protein
VSEATPERFLGITVNGEAFGLPLRQLIGVEPISRIVPVPNVPPWLLGVTYHQSRVLSVTDLGAFLELGPAAALAEGTARLLIAADGDNAVAFAVPAVTGVVSVQADQVGPVPSAPASPVNRFLRGLVFDGDRKVGLLDLVALLRSPEFQTTS